MIDCYSTQKMITRSSVRRERELSGTSTKHSRRERKKRFAGLEQFVSPYNLRSSMGKRAGTATRLRNGVTSDVSPIQLFPLEECGNSPVETASKVCLL